MKNKKYIFFDLDNTLWDYRQNAKLTIKRLFEEYDIKNNHNHDFSEFYNAYYQANEMLWNEFRHQKISKEELMKRRFENAFAMMNLKDDKLAEEFNNRFISEITNPNVLVEYAVEILEYLKKKEYHLHVITNGFEDLSHKKINGSILKNYIATTTSSEEAGVPKPDPKPFQISLEKANGVLEQSVYIGDDWEADIIGAKEFGMDAIFFNPLSENHIWIEEVPIIDKLKELKNHL